MKLKGTSNLNFNKTDVLYLIDDCGTIITAEIVRLYPLTVRLVYEEKFFDPIKVTQIYESYKYSYVHVGESLYRLTRDSRWVRSLNKILNLPEEEILIYRKRDKAMSSCIKLLINKK